MSDVYSTLQTLTWKGLELPCSEAEFGSSFRIPRHSLDYHSGQLLDNLGANSEGYSYTVPLYQTMRGRWANGFTKIFPELLERLREETPGALIDPLLGPTEAMVAEYGWKLTNSSGRSGVTVQLSLIQSTDPEDTETERPLTLEALEVAVKEHASEKIYNEQEELEGPSLDPFSVPHLLASQVMLNVNKVAATMDAVAFKLNRSRESIEQLNRVRDWRVIAASKRLARAAEAAALAPVPRKRFRYRQIFETVELSQLASKLGVSTDHLQKHNDILTPFVQPGTAIKYEVEK